MTIVKAAVGKDAADHIAAGKTLAELVPVTGFADTVPIPLTGVVSLPSFPVDAFPKPIADMVRAVAEATQTDPAMAGTSRTVGAVRLRRRSRRGRDTVRLARTTVHLHRDGRRIR